MIDKKTFKRAVGDTLRAAGFLNKGQSWYLDGPDSIVVLNFQKSDFDDKYYVNFGIWLKSLGDAELPPENQCHVQSRATSLFPDHVRTVEEGCSLANGTEEGLKQFIDLLGSQFAEFCRGCLVLENLKAMFLSGRLSKSLVTKAAKELLAG